MADTIAVNSSPSQGCQSTNTRTESGLQGYSIVKVHTCIISLIGVLGFCLQLKFPNVSPYMMVYGSLLMNVFIIVTCIYILSLILTAILADTNDADVDDVMIKITLLLGSLSLILEILVLLLPFGLTLLFFWCICLICFVKKSYRSLKTLFHNALAPPVRVIGEVKQKLTDSNRLITESNAIAAVARVSKKLKDLVIKNDEPKTEHEGQNQNHTTEVPV